MAITSINASAYVPESDPFPVVGKKELNRQDFMTLFITQLQYQDPMKPMDSYEMASQLAQFSTMDSTMQMTETMEELLAYQTSQNNLQLLTLLDSEVQASGNMIGVNEGGTTVTEFIIPDVTSDCRVEIYDAADHQVRVIDMGAISAGTYELDWDTKDQRGDQVPDGAYYYKVKALNVAGNNMEADYRSTGRVTGIEFESGQALLTVNGYVNLSVAEVLKVN
ncbi:MAG: flagellar hook assembly protein FlgD [Proteobacteria bacterium]|nr:flagellar hook assembly protein FlgD [Pseudomonadota bacterium]MBU1710529.1 flagellar hook assembly protein FlgD [Pseudomonadota bacterium]